jgi:4,5-dihydroxyphthalate decarboxylase
MVMRRELYDRNPWIAMNLVKAFEEAKNRSLERVAADLESFLPLPWAPSEAGLARKMLGEDYWPYGIEPNRATLEAFAQYAFEQGVCHRRVALEELFPPEVQTRFKI